MGDCIYFNETTTPSPFSMCSEPMGGGLAPRRPWLVDDLQGTLSHILHPCQVGAGGREAGSTQSSLSGNREQHRPAGALGGGRRTRRVPNHSSRLGPSQEAASVDQQVWHRHKACGDPRFRPLCDHLPFLRSRSCLQRLGSSFLCVLCGLRTTDSEQWGRRRKGTKGEPGMVRARVLGWQVS